MPNYLDRICIITGLYAEDRGLRIGNDKALSYIKYIDVRIRLLYIRIIKGRFPRPTTGLTGEEI